MPPARPRPPIPAAGPTAHTTLDAALDAAYETHRRFRHGPFSVGCPTCHVAAGALCLARRSVHAARREEYRRSHRPAGLLARLAAPA